jgi:hypothetical protein
MTKNDKKSNLITHDRGVVRVLRGVNAGGRMFEKKSPPSFPKLSKVDYIVISNCK